MYLSTTVNKPFTQLVAEARPLSHLAAATLLATSIYAVHKGAELALTQAPGLVAATTFAIIGFEWVQWTSMGRIAKLEDAGQHSRAGVLKLQCLGIAILQVILYTIAVVGFAKAGGADWSNGWPLVGSIAIAALYSGLNFIIKWTSCDHVEKPEAASVAGPNGGKRSPIDDALFGTSAAKPAKSDGVVSLKERVAREAEQRPFRPTGLTPAPKRKSTSAATSEWAREMANHRWQAEAEKRAALG